MLPKVNEYKTYEIRLESIGGLGANLCGKLLGEIGAIALGLNAVSFASYGSEKKGSPVKSYIRFADANTEILINSPVTNPHLLGLFHEAMLTREPVTAGVDENTDIVINTDKKAEEIRGLLKLHGGRLFCIDALKIAMEHKTRVNMVMLGAMAKASGFIPLEACLDFVTQTLGKKYPAVLEGNLAGIREGYKVADGVMFKNDEKYPYVEYKETQRDWGYDNAPIGGINPMFGSTVTNDLSASREGYVPVFIKEKCINCGLCDTTCPDMVYQFVKGEYKGKPAMVNLGPDYHHCKGCMRCVVVCPVAAIVSGYERETDIAKIHVRNQALIVKKLAFEMSGPSGWIESESHTNELV